MKAKPLYMIWDDDPEQATLSMERYKPCRPAKASEITLESMAVMLDLDAENCNAHDFVGVHTKLAALLFQDVGRKQATATFRRIVNYRGLHGMEGICGVGTPEACRKELGVPKSIGEDFTFTKR